MRLVLDMMVNLSSWPSFFVKVFSFVSFTNIYDTALSANYILNKILICNIP